VKAVTEGRPAPSPRCDRFCLRLPPDCSTSSACFGDGDNESDSEGGDISRTLKVRGMEQGEELGDRKDLSA